jgi:hypothetical protein
MPFIIHAGTKMLESQERRMSMLNHKLKKLNLPTRDVQPSELISNEMERIALMKEARAKGVYYDMLEVSSHSCIILDKKNSFNLHSVITELENCSNCSLQGYMIQKGKKKMTVTIPKMKQ